MQSILLIIKKHVAFIISTSTFIINTFSNFYQTKTRKVFACWNFEKNDQTSPFSKSRRKIICYSLSPEATV